MRRVLSLRRRSWCATALILVATGLVLALAATGCGDDGPKRVTYGGRTTPAVVDADAATEIMAVLFSNPHFPPLSPTSSPSASGGAPSTTMLVAGSLRAMAGGLTAPAAMAASAGTAEAPETYPVEASLRGSVAGVIELKGRTDRRGVGQLAVEWHDFDDGAGYVVDGQSTLYVDEVDYRWRLTRARIDMARVEFRGGSLHRTVSGWVLIEADPSQNFERIGFDIDVEDDRGRREHRMQPFEISTFFDASYSPMSQSMQGRLFVDRHGWVDVWTEQPLTCNQCELGTPNAGGPIVINAVGPGRARALPSSVDTVRIEVDADGDAQWEKLGIYKWAEIGQAPVRNTAPSVVRVTLDPDPVNATMDLTVSAEVVDQDRDPVEVRYAWTRNGAPIEGQTGPTLPAGSFVRGDRVEAIVTADDGELQASGIGSIVASNAAPVADAGPNLVRLFDTVVPLDARGSYDIDGDPLMYSWHIQHKPADWAPVEMTSADSELAAVRLGMQGGWIFGLTVSDGIYAANGTTILEVEPWPLFEAPVNSEALGDIGTIQCIALGDFTGDGLIDRVFASSHQASPVIRVGVAAQRAFGWFEPPTWYAIPTSAGQLLPWSIDVADLDGDHRLDVVVAAGAGVVVLHQLAAGGLGDPVAYTLPGESWLGRKRAIATDISGDGLDDVVAVSSSSSGAIPQAAVWLQGDDGTLSDPVLHALPWMPDDLAVGDVDGDDRPDVVLQSSQGTWALLQRLGGGLESAELLAGDPVPSSLPMSIAIGDIDGQGRDDLVIGGASGFVIHDQVAPGEFQERAPQPTQGGADVLALADIDQDGRLDVIVVDAWDGVGVLLQREDGSMLSDQRYEVWYHAIRPETLVVADGNGDGRPDVLTARQRGFTLLRGLAPAP